MTATVEYMSHYDQRVRLVTDVLRNHSKLSEKDSFALAERVLEALDHMPEKVR
ncbi:DUF6307 family protein [Kibdelosporangium aridum]|uniref:DUF6307 family protein n=1 Tax=Kibdelosporangium aridum TaxID=2030 RepID=UPI0035EF31E5